MLSWQKHDARVVPTMQNMASICYCIFHLDVILGICCIFANETAEPGVIASYNLAEPEGVYLTFLQNVRVPVLARRDRR
jgi:hypothetical protein